MKVNFKKIITVLAASVMCAVPMAGSLSANAAPEEDDDYAWLQELKRKVDQEAFRANIHDYEVVEIVFPPEREPGPKPNELGRIAGTSKIERVDKYGLYTVDQWVKNGGKAPGGNPQIIDVRANAVLSRR